MDTLITVCDSVATCTNSVANGCQPIVRVAETNCADVKITMLICGTIIIVSLLLFILIGYYIYSHYNNQEKIYDSSSRQPQTKQPEKTNSEKAVELLDNIVNKAKNKEGEICQEKIKELFEIYKTIKDDFANEANGKD